MIEILRCASNSSMVVAKGTITTSNLNMSARTSAKKNVSPRGPRLPCTPGPCWEVWVLAGLFQELGRFGADIIQSGGKMGPRMRQVEDVLGKRGWERKQWSRLASIKRRGVQRGSGSGGVSKTKSGEGPVNQPSAGHQAGVTLGLYFSPNLLTDSLPFLS